MAANQWHGMAWRRHGSMKAYQHNAARQQWQHGGIEMAPAASITLWHGVKTSWHGGK